MRQRLHFVPVGVHFRDESLIELLLALVVDCIRALQLCVFGSHARARGNRLQISAAHGQHDQFARVLRRVAIGFGDIARRAVIVDRGKIENGLRKMRAKIDVIKRADHRGNYGPRKIETETFRAQVRGLHIFGNGTIQVRQQAAERHLALPIGLAHGLGRAGLAQVKYKPAFNRFPQSQLPVERHFRDAGSASRIRALHLHAGTERVDRGRGAGRGRFGCFHTAAGLRGSTGERKLRGLRACRLSGRRAELRERGRGENQCRRDKRRYAAKMLANEF